MSNTPTSDATHGISADAFAPTIAKLTKVANNLSACDCADRGCVLEAVVALTSDEIHALLADHARLTASLAEARRDGELLEAEPLRPYIARRIASELKAQLDHEAKPFISGGQHHNGPRRVAPVIDVQYARALLAHLLAIAAARSPLPEDSTDGQ